MLNLIVRFDHWLFFKINGLGCDTLDDVFYDLTMLGGWTIILIALAMLSVYDKRTFLRHLLVFAVMMTVTATVNRTLKSATDRSRPCKYYKEQIKAGTVDIHVAGDTVKRKSFPSGHSMLAFFAMTYVVCFRRAAKWWLLSLAALISFSRIYVGAHFPLDCLAGSLLGAAGALLARQVYLIVDRRTNHKEVNG